ncbi:hypothetical protein I3760_12G013300 [Carya illinoinensis]|nr:hypothetical protein I3760_12G013300 [Carya illinoinensis]
MITLFELTFAKVIECSSLGLKMGLNWGHIIGSKPLCMKKKYCSVLLLCIELCQGLLSLLCGRIPIWAYAKLILTCWLVIPYFSGAAYVYEHYVRPFFVNQQTINIWYVPRKKDIFSKPNDILTAAEQYIAENGTEEFQKMINKADKSRNEDHPSYDEDYRY